MRVVKPTKDFRIDMQGSREGRSIGGRGSSRCRRRRCTTASSTTSRPSAISRTRMARYVYADIIHSAGAEPFDVKASGVDFAACSTLQVADGRLRHRLPLREGGTARSDSPAGDGLLPGAEPRTVLSAESAGRRVRPGDVRTSSGAPPDSSRAAHWRAAPRSTSHCSTASLNYITSIGVANIQAHRQPLIGKLQQEVPRLGFTPRHAARVHQRGRDVREARTSRQSGRSAARLQAGRRQRAG